MRKLGPIAAGGFYLTDGLPDEYYALTGGELSLTVERGGGINTLGVLDVLECGGKYYPDRSMTPPVIQREGQRCGLRPLYGPGVQFISTNTLADGRMGRNLFHVPDVLELYPFGFYGESTRFGHAHRLRSVHRWAKRVLPLRQCLPDARAVHRVPQ